MAIIRVGGVVDCGVKVESTPSELTPNFRDHLFVKGYSGIRREAEAALAALDLTDVRNLERRDFWRAAAITCEGMETLAARYAEKAGSWPPPKPIPSGRLNCGTSPKPAAASPWARPPLSGTRSSRSISPYAACSSRERRRLFHRPP